MGQKIESADIQHGLEKIGIDAEVTKNGRLYQIRITTELDAGKAAALKNYLQTLKDAGCNFMHTGGFREKEEGR